MKRKIGFYLLLGGILSLAFIKKSDEKQINIVIDAGHGGKDYGATHEGYYEKDIVDAISAKIKAQNTNSNIVLHFTRTSDEFVGLKNRTDLINSIKPDLVLSLHITHNGNTAASGSEIFIAKEGPNKEKSSELATALSEKLKQNTTGFRGIKEAPFFILKKSEAPALLVELGFLSNPNDRAFLLDDANQKQIANAILDFAGELK